MQARDRDPEADLALILELMDFKRAVKVVERRQENREQYSLYRHGPLASTLPVQPSVSRPVCSEVGSRTRRTATTYSLKCKLGKSRAC